MSQPKYRGYVSEAGTVSFIDPDFDTLALIQSLHPEFAINSEPPPQGFVPALLRTRQQTTAALSLNELAQVGEPALWELHDRLVRSPAASAGGKVSLLDIKVELAARALQCCRLCGYACAVNRFRTAGRCQLKDEGYYQAVYVHIAEEPVITPCLVVKLYGCALRCKGCQAFDVLPIASDAKPLGPSLWQEVRQTSGFDQAIALQWVGGNPDESLYSILYTCQFAPDLRLPMVWNAHGYGSHEVYRLLEGVVDVFVLDFKFGPGSCGEAYAGVAYYWDYAAAGVEEVIRQGAKLIVRILIMPGHVACCHTPALQWLSQYREHVWLSLLEFTPMWRAVSDAGLRRRTTLEELQQVRKTAKDCGLREIDESQRRFWLARP
jgi:putative pyruvate formate lyase activating enzyme